jgi:hypothetical protein
VRFATERARLRNYECRALPIAAANLEKAMTPQKTLAVSIGARMTKAYCMPLGENLSPDQLSALHLCKHEIISAIFRLYMQIPREVADPIIGKYVTPPSSND